MAIIIDITFNDCYVFYIDLIEVKTRSFNVATSNKHINLLENMAVEIESSRRPKRTVYDRHQTLYFVFAYVILTTLTFFGRGSNI